MYTFLSQWSRNLLLGLTFILLVLTFSQAINREAVALENSNGSDNSQITEQMAAFLADRQPNHNLPAMPITPCVGGMAGSYPCNNVDLLAFMPLADIGGGSGNDSWGWTGCGTREFAIMGRSSGTSFVEITDPVNPIYLGNLPTHTGSSSWRDIKTYADHAFIVSEASGHGMQIFDLTQLCSVPSPPVTFSNTTHYSGFGSAHNIVINEDSGYAYSVGADCSGGLHMVDIQTPLSPNFAGCFSADGYTHDAQCVIYNGPDTTHQGKEICFNSNEDTLTIVDVTNKAAPVQLSRTGYSGSGYTHQSWLTEDHVYVLLGDELDEQSFGHNTRTYMWDVSDLDNPVLDGNFTATTPAIDHNMYIKGTYAYQSNYRAGLRILDISDISNTNLIEEAYFDIYPSSDSASFNGAWSNYPYFDSGVVIVSGIEQGLFILQPTSLTADFSITTTPDTLAVCTPSDAVYTVTITGFSGFAANVTLSASGHPNPPNTVSFSVNNQVPPYTSTMTVGTTGATAGSYAIDVVGISPTSTHTTTVELNVAAGVPAAPTLVTPGDGASNISVTPLFEWTAVAQTNSYFLEVATDAAFSSVVYSTNTSATSHTIPAGSELTSNTTYYWRITASNGCGSGSASATFSFTTEPLAGDCNPGSTPVTVYSEDFESGDGGWTHSAGQGSDTWTLSSSNPHSGSMAFHADDVASISDQYLVSPAIVLPSGQSPLTFQFWNYQEMEDGGAGCYDGGILEVSADGGSTWDYLNSELLTDPYDGPIDGGFQNPLIGFDAWCGDPQAYLNSIVDIDAYAGQSVQFRFRLGTDSSVSHPGWDVDDVTVQACASTVNSAPVAVADVYSTTHALALTVAAPGVLDNDTDGDGDTLTAVLDTTTSHGALLLNGDGSFVYTPTLGFAGDDTFTYHTHDGLAGSNVVTVTIAVLNMAPMAVADAYMTDQDVMLTVAAPGVLDNDVDGDGDVLTAVLDTDVMSGTLALNADGSFDYTPDAGFVGEDSFTYHAHDGVAGSNVVTVTIVVEEVEHFIFLPFVVLE